MGNKFRKFAFVLFILCVTQIHLTVGLLSWLFGENDAETRQSNEQVPAAVITSKTSTPFEMQTADDKFLAQAQFTKDLSPLDVCHHGVIAELASTCSELTEEQLGKLAVQLLNCQSQAEGRPVYPCTSDMSIAECTGDMEPVTWNAYQIVSNRARAVCYATRQQQFRLKTEFTVNQLVHTARGQLDTLHQIQDGHHELHDLAQSTQHKLQDSHQRISDSQERLLLANRNVNSYIVGNIKELTREKALIASGNKELAALTEDLKDKLDETKEKILEQGVNQKENHDEILDDLASIRDKAREVWNKIDESSKDMMQYQDEAKEHYRRTLLNLQKVNSTIQYLEATIHNTKAELESKLDWLVGMVGGTGDKVALLSTLFLHAVYLLLGALSSAFLQTPRFSRLLLLALVPLNAWAQVHTRKSLGFLPMTMFIVLTVAANWAMTWTWYLYLRYTFTKQCLPQLPMSSIDPKTKDRLKSTPESAKAKSQGLSSPDLHKLVSILENMYNSGLLQGTPNDVDGTPKRPLAITQIATPWLNNPENTPCSPRFKDGQDLHRISMVKRHLVDDMDEIPTSTPRRNNSPAPSMSSTPIKRTPEKINSSVVYAKKGSPTGSEIITPAKHRPSKRPRTPRTPRVSTPNKSVSRALCLATTKSGMPCKLQSVDSSAFCHKHQVTK